MSKAQPAGHSKRGVAEIFDKFFKQRCFSAASLALSYRIGDEFNDFHSTFGYLDNVSEKRVTTHTLFDLASLTKPLVTLLSILTLVERKNITLDSSIGQFFPELAAWDHRSATIYRLLSHQAGLVPHLKLWEHLCPGLSPAEKRHRILDSIIRHGGSTQHPGEPVYSDIGYILLGYVVECVTSLPLNHFWNDAVCRPLGLQDALLFPENSDKSPYEYASCGYCHLSQIKLQGIVHDDNCRGMGGVAGHAGLFGTAPAILTVCREMLNLYNGISSPLPIGSRLFRKIVTRIDGSDWSAGFQLPSSKKSSSGKYFSKESFGHLGFTGTSFWVDPRRPLIVVLLTNRVCMGTDKSAIQRLRPEIHNCIVDNIEEMQGATFAS